MYINFAHICPSILLISIVHGNGLVLVAPLACPFLMMTVVISFVSSCFDLR